MQCALQGAIFKSQKGNLKANVGTHIMSHIFQTPSHPRIIIVVPDEIVGQVQSEPAKPGKCMQPLSLWRKHQLYGERTGGDQKVESYTQHRTLSRETLYASAFLDSSPFQAPSMAAASLTRTPTREF